MNIVLLVIDSLRASSLDRSRSVRPVTPFLDGYSAEASYFRRAYSTECWTLPSHVSMFTGLLPSEHQAHFQTMNYYASAPTIAELLSAAGHYTEVVTRNFIFDGAIPGVTRGFAHSTHPVADQNRPHLFALLLGLAKPRFRRHVTRTGFFHPFHKANRAFLRTFAQTLLPADDRALSQVLRRMSDLRMARHPYFLFCNLYDVHAPYPPANDSVLGPLRCAKDYWAALRLPRTMARLGAHGYLRPGAHVSDGDRGILLGRYHRAIELMDAKLAQFYQAAHDAGLLDDTLFILTSDHGEAFGEHDLYLHDASVYDTHLHVPLWIRHPGQSPAVIHDIVSTRDLFGLIRSVALENTLKGTILESAYRRANPVAAAEHFYYPHSPTMADKYRVNQRALITEEGKFVVRGGSRPVVYDLAADPGEEAPNEVGDSDVRRALRRSGLPEKLAETASDHLLHQAAA